MMTAQNESTPAPMLVAIDVAKRWNVVLVEGPDGRRQRFRVANTRSDHDRFVQFLKSQSAQCQVALEPTGMYHRPLGYRLLCEGFEGYLVSSVAAARFREALFNSWDKNDPKDAAVILDLLKQGKTLRYYDPVIEGIHDIQELAKTYVQVSLARTRLQHSLLTHFLPIYWPEFGRFWHSSRAHWFVSFLHGFPVPEAVRRLDRETFIREAWSLVGRKVGKRARLEEIYELAGETIALPISPDSLAVQTMRFQLERYLSLNRLRDQLENWAKDTLGTNEDFQLLRTIPGIGPVLALVILAEGGDLRRFGHHRQFLKFCGLDLAKSQSGASRGQERLSKRGNARLRYAFWFAATVAVRMRENSFRYKYERYILTDPTDPDRKRKALTAVAAKMARVAYAIVKTGVPYRAYFEATVPSGSIPFSRAVEAARTS
jgi:transposase